MKRTYIIVLLMLIFTLQVIDASAVVKKHKTTKHKKSVHRKTIKKKTPSIKLQNVFSFTGRGYGHGVGMTQYGAEGMAEHGYDYKSIVKYYYTGVNIENKNTTETSIDVALRLNTPTVLISSKSVYSINDSKTNTKLMDLPANMKIKIQYKNGGFVITTDDPRGIQINLGPDDNQPTTPSSIDMTTSGAINSTTQSSIDTSSDSTVNNITTKSAVNLSTTINAITVKGTNNATLAFKGNSYLGDIKLSKDNSYNNNLDVINTLSVENYLRGVIPSEIYSTWKSEAVKAQILASRTYALKQISLNKTRKFDVYDTILSQVYNGESANVSRINNLINATSGEVITYKGDLIDALFSASAGGYTVDASYIWGVNVPYLKGKADPFDKSSYSFNWWNYKIKRTDLQKLFPTVGTIYKVQVVNRKFLRPTELRITGSKGCLYVSSPSFRSKLSYNNIVSAIFSV